MMTLAELMCSTPDDNMPYISKTVIIAFVSVAVIGTISYFLRYELFLICRNVIKTLRKSRIEKVYIHDAYIACNEEDPTIRRWVISVLFPYLATSNLNVFLPCLHGCLGTPREEEIIDVMYKCRTFLIILSENYNGNINWNEIEWKHAWHNWTRDINRELIIINYDMISAHEINSKYLSAFLKLGMFIDFSNNKKCIEKEIQMRISMNQNPNRPVRDWFCYGCNEERKIDEVIPLLQNGTLFNSYGQGDNCD